MVLPSLSVVYSPSDSVASSSLGGAIMRSASLKRSTSAAARAAFFDAFESLAAGAFAVAPPFFALLSFFELLSLAASFAGAAAAAAFFDFGPIARTRALRFYEQD